MKKLFALLICLSLILSAVPNVFAASLEPIALPSEPEITPLWEQIARAQTKLSINGSGQANVYCLAQGVIASTTKVEIEAKLQRSWGIFWITEETFTLERGSYFANLSKTYTVESGHTYRIKATVTVYSGTNSEKTTVYSEVIEY